MRKYSLVFILMFFSTSSYAVTDGSGWKIVAQMAQLLKQTKEYIDTAKNYYSTAQDIKAYAESDSKSTNMVTDPEFYNLLYGISNIKDMRDLGSTFTNIQQINNSLSQINNKIDEAKTEDERRRWQDHKNTLLTLRKIKRMKDVAFKKQKKTVGDPDERDTSRTTAYATTGIYQLMLDETERVKIDEARKRENKSIERSFISRTGAAYRSVGK